MIFWLVGIITVVLDQVTKYIVQTNMQEWQSIPLIQDVFHLTYVLNPGAAFSMLPNKTGFLILIAVLVVVGIVFFNRQLPSDKHLMRVALGLQVGGALGNLIDRLRFAHVVDFFDFRVFPVFNIADIAISVGVGLLILEIILQEIKHKAEVSEGLCNEHDAEGK